MEVLNEQEEDENCDTPEKHEVTEENIQKDPIRISSKRRVSFSSLKERPYKPLKEIMNYSPTQDTYIYN